MIYKNNDDEISWKQCHADDAWIFDKLILSRRLGYLCGPKGVSVPSPNNYIIRPCVNLMGMGRGAHIAHLCDSTDEAIPDGTFWCEIFTGRHLSVDYHYGEQVLCVEGLRDKEDLDKWAMWHVTDDVIPMPNILKELKGIYEWINIEMIGDKVIEVHLRRNPDFVGHSSPYIIPSYGDTEMDGHFFVESKDYNRIGFFIPY